MKTNKKTLILTTLVCLIPIVAGALLYSRLPETMATHWNMNGEPDGWSSRAFAVFGLPGILLAVNLILPFALKADPKHGNMSDALVKITIWSIPLISLLCCGLTLARGLGCTVSVEFWVPVFMGVLFIVIGNYLPKTKQSYTMGIKLPWTLDSEENWNRTHRLAGYLWVLGGVLFLVMSFVGWSLAAFLIILAVMVLVPTAYSYLLYRKGV
ncbi:MAG: SdpI family protein [Oscillospiraceae bacterium]|nr:SdpI family protein [Oscillospiraceae bacterium]